MYKSQLLPLILLPLTTSTPFPLPQPRPLPPSDPTPLFRTNFYSGIHCTGLRTGTFTGPNDLPNQQTNPEIPATYQTCLPIPSPGITSAAMFQSVINFNHTSYANHASSSNSSSSQYVFRLHADPHCGDNNVVGEEERWGGGRSGNATRYCVRTSTVPGALAWSVRVRGFLG